MIGQTISHYEILEQLGSGGMGVVYKARDTKLDRILALKFLPAKVARDEDAKQRFMQEAKAASSLDDPHICTIYEIGETEDGQLFIAMAYYDGSTLQDLIEKRKIKIDDAASIARQMAKGLSTAHEAGIVHRDVKPANVMVTRKGLVKLLDFGVAKLGESSDLTREGSTIGTASYMSPEQARGEQVDARSDIWSIGAVLYEMLTGARPFGGGYEAAVAYSIINEDPPPIAPARPDTPEGLVDVVHKALSKNAEERYPTARALADALGEYSGETIVETAPQPAYRPSASSASDVPSVQKLVVRFAIVGALVLALVYAAMIGLGLPDWVFPAAVLLTLVGLPITLYAANVEKKRAGMDSGERANLDGLKARLTTKLAYKGGLIAAGILVLAIIGYTGLRAAGIGPFASLITSGVLDDDDFIIVTDFENQTDTPDLGSTVARALRIDLSQSTAVSVMDEGQIHAALIRMELPPDTMVSAGLAIDIALREGVKAVVEGEISKVGSGFQLSAGVVAADTHTEVFAVREAARDDSDILAAIDRLSAKLRQEIGESLVSIRSNPPLEQVSTASLDALRHYSRAEELDQLGRDDEALAEVEQAIEADSLFGMAYRKKAVILNNMNIRFQEARETRQKAFDLRHRMTERERLLTEGTFWADGGIDVFADEEKAKAAYRDVLEKWPNDLTALNNLANELGNYGSEAQEAMVLYRRALDIEEGEVFRQNVLRLQASTGDLEGFNETARIMRSLYPDNGTVFVLRRTIAFSMDSLDAAMEWDAKLDSLLLHDDNEFTVPSFDQERQILLAQGKFDEARDRQIEFNKSPAREELMRLMNPTREWDDTTRAIQMLWPEVTSAQRIFELTGDRERFDRIIEQMRVWAPDFRSERTVEDFLTDEGKISGIAPAAIDDAARLDGDLDKAVRFVNAVDSLVAAGHEYISPFVEESMDVARHAVLGMTSDDPTPHVAAIESVLDVDDRRFFNDVIGQIWDHSGETDKAIEAYTRFVSGFDFSALSEDRGRVAKIHFRLGELHEQQGNLDQAIHHYQKMVDRWKDADAILQPQVEEARRRIDQLLDQKAQEPS